MKKIKLLYITTLLQSIHEYRFLSLLGADPDIDLIVVSNSTEECHPKIKALGIKIFCPYKLSFSLKNRLLDTFVKAINNFFFLKLIRKVIGENDIDLIHSGWLTWDSYLAVKSGFRPILAMSWGSDVLPNPYIRNAHNSKRLMNKLKVTARNVDLVYSDAEYVADTLSEITGVSRRKVTVFPQLGVDTAFFKPNQKLRNITRKKYGLEKETLVLSVRNFAPIYSVHDTINAFAGLREEKINAKLFLAGDGPLKKELFNLVQTLKLENDVLFLGKINNEQLNAFYNAADIYISTSLSDGASLSLLEALSCGLAPVVTDIPSIMEWIENDVNGWVVKRNNVNSISAGLEAAVNSCILRKQYGNYNRQLAEQKIDLNKNYQKLKCLYRKLCLKSGIHKDE